MSFDNADGPPGPLNGDSRSGQSPTITHQLDTNQPADHDITASRQVSWWPVYDYINRQRRRFGALELSGPLLGTPAWVVLPDDHPAKLSAVLNAAEAVAYSVNADQAAAAAASRAISAAADWSAIAKANRDRADFLAAHPWAKRVTDDGAGTATLPTDAVNTVGNAANTWARRVVEDGSAKTVTTKTAHAATANAVEMHAASTALAATANEAMDAAVDMRDASTALAATANAWAERVVA